MASNRSAWWKRIGSNAAANVCSGATVALSQLLMTAIAARVFEPETFAQWTLLISLAALSPLFGASLASIVTRRLVQVDRGADEQSRAAIYAASQRLARQLGLLAFVAIGLLAVAIRPWSLPLQHMAWSTLIATSVLLVGGHIWQVTQQPAMGWHFARENAWHVAGATGLVRVGSLAGMVAAWSWFDGQVTLAAALVCTGAWLAVLICRQAGFVPRFSVQPSDGAVDHHTVEIWRLAKAFAVWSAGSAVILYGLPAMMSTLAGARYNAFYLAYTLNLVALGVVGSVATALMAPVTRAVSARNQSALIRASLWGPVCTAVALVLLLACLQAATPFILKHLAPGVASSQDVAGFVYLLGFQSIARSLALVFSVILSAAGSPRQVTLPIVAEMVLVIGVALPAGLQWGDTVFLATLGVAGAVSALVVVILTTGIVGFSSRERLRIILAFNCVQALAAAVWAWRGSA
jgi:hypothetical protein